MARRRPQPAHSPRRGAALTGLLSIAAGAGAALAVVMVVSRAPTTAPEEGPAPGTGEPQLVEVAKRILHRPTPTRVVYLNREGAALTGGPDDATANISSVVANSPASVAHIPPFAGTPARFAAIAKCIRQKFAPFNVQVVEQRPVADDYLMVLLGGDAKDLGMKADDGHEHSHATGLAPFNGEAIPGAVVYVFTRTLRENTRSVCETAGMEIAHAYGLDHARDCKDLMTYMKPCGARSFVDRSIPCGEHKDRPCASGQPHQNSYRLLMDVLGPAPVGAP